MKEMWDEQQPGSWVVRWFTGVHKIIKTKNDRNKETHKDQC